MSSSPIGKRAGFLSCALAGLALPLASGQVQDDEIARLVERLGAEDFETRENAQARLLEIGGADDPRVARALHCTFQNPEVAARAVQILAELPWLARRDDVLGMLRGDDWVREWIRETTSERLYPWVALVHDSPRILGSQFDPARLARTVNELSGLGPEGALQILSEYDRLSDLVIDAPWASKVAAGRVPELDRKRIFLVLRLLFVPRENAIWPPLVIGAPDLEIPSGAWSDWPLFPIMVVEDVPFLCVNGYVLGGEGEPPGVHLAYAQEHCALRSVTLLPGSPVEAAESLLTSARWTNLRGPGRPPPPDAWHQGMIRLQALRALGELHPLSDEDESRLYPHQGGDLDSEWSRHAETARALDAAWDPERQAYRRRDR